MTEFRGVYPAQITPFNVDGEFNEDAFRKVMEFNIQAGVHGFWTCGGTGESVLLREDEVVRIAEVAINQAAGRVKNIIHVGALTTTQAARTARAVGNLGADAICAVPPFFYHPSEQAIIDHYKAVSEAGGKPFFVYNLPQSTGVEITAGLMEKLVKEVPLLAGVKHSAPNFENIRNFASLGMSTFTGNAYLLLPALLMGATGGIDGPPNIAPEIWVDIYDKYQAGELKGAQLAQEWGAMLTDLTRANPFPAAAKFLLGARLGIDCGEARAPLSGLSQEQKTHILRRAEELGVLPVAQAAD